MSKKSKRRATPRDTSLMAALPSTPAPTRVSEFKPDYTYVIHDLRRIGLIAGTFILILVALAFVLH